MVLVRSGGGEKRGERTCHFRQEGLKLGLPWAASSSEMKTWRVGWELGVGDRAGRSFAGYVVKGKTSKSRWSGPGMGGIHDLVRGSVIFDGFVVLSSPGECWSCDIRRDATRNFCPEVGGLEARA